MRFGFLEWICCRYRLLCFCWGSLGSLCWSSSLLFWLFGVSLSGWSTKCRRELLLFFFRRIWIFSSGDHFCCIWIIASNLGFSICGEATHFYLRNCRIFVWWHWLIFSVKPNFCWSSWSIFKDRPTYFLKFFWWAEIFPDVFPFCRWSRWQLVIFFPTSRF